MRKGIALAVAVLALALPSSASAVFHLMKISEVGNSNPTDNVELQMYSAGQNLVGGHYIRVYRDDGTEQSTFEFPGGVAQSANQRTILIARDDSPAPVTPDFLAPDANDVAIPANGTVCFLDTIAPEVPIDCVSFGLLTAPPPFATGISAPVLTAGDGANSLQRNIAPNCPTALDAADDTDDSFTDFSLAAPTPRNNATAPTETPCPDPPGGGGGDTNDPQTTITKEPKNKSAKRKAKWAFTSDEPGSTFECKLDGKGFKPCDSPYVKRVKVGKHKFEVAAIDPAGNRDETPDRDRFKRRPR